MSPALTPEIALNFRLRSSLARTFHARSGARSGDIPSRNCIKSKLKVKVNHINGR
jgi:hypothetical protein